MRLGFLRVDSIFCLNYYLKPNIEKDYAFFGLTVLFFAD